MKSTEIPKALFWFTFMSGEGLVVCLEIFFSVYSSGVAFWNTPPPPPAVYIRPAQCIIAPARSSDCTTWLMLNCSRSKMCLLINREPRASLFTVVMVAVSYLENTSLGFLFWDCLTTWGLVQNKNWQRLQHIRRNFLLFGSSVDL